eukprot:CAMPEP_0116147504 /NCGR_PEP_ID=MMETSP0329-20121206/17788_1 /TAXON_ID=697910 /ORGANISM="Pseudo-nitzschia arenysensis, Strain B593" /LENGTH=646 /DNA_ID=CAMNT_0003643433 /DNA_START=38 /DNA_END=1978 /DNA_ORIENTATION=+
MKFSSKVLTTALLVAAPTADAFVTRSSSASNNVMINRDSDTSLHAMPPLIIGPMLKKMREEKMKKQQPMATEEEMKGEAPGLRVGGSTWKWPPVWPYDQTFFTPKDDIPKGTPGANPMAQMMTNGAPVPPQPEVVEVEKLDPIKYWQEEKGDVKTEMDEDAAAKLQSHYAFYLKDGMSVLELGAAETSYLPENLKLARHVGVGLNDKLMEENSSLTEKYVVDLNEVVVDGDVDSDELRKLMEDPFDVIIMSNTADFLMHPREVFKSAFLLLKPGGTCINAFSTTKAFGDKFSRAQTRMWVDYNDDQHMWVAGSFYQFSAGDGWQNVRGFDLSPESAKDNFEKGGPLQFLEQGKDNNVYAVQATKGLEDEDIDESDPAKSINSRMWMLPTMEDRDKKLVVPRLGRSYSLLQNPKRKDAISDNIQYLPRIYEALIKMDTFAFTFEMQSQLAADLVLDPDFNANDKQIFSLKEGLGLRTPSPDFWAPVGELTAGMDIDDKINLLSYIVPRFGSGDEEQEAALQTYASGLKPTFECIRTKCPDLSESDVQLLGTELLNAEILIPGKSTKEEFAAWLGSMSGDEMKNILSVRKGLNEDSSTQLEAYKVQLKEREEQQVEIRKKYEEQVKEARENRSIVFNPGTGKFQELKK